MSNLNRSFKPLGVASILTLLVALVITVPAFADVSSVTITSPSSTVHVLPGGSIDITYSITVSRTDKDVDVLVKAAGGATNPPIVHEPLSGNTITATTTVQIPVGTAPGTYDISVWARQQRQSNGGSDPWGGWQIKSALGAVIVDDPSPPPTSVDPLVLTAPVGITVEGNTVGGASGVSLGSPSAAGGVAPYTFTNNALAFFPLGTTTVTWTVTDAVGTVATATQDVTVVDTTAPTLTVPGDVTFEGNTIGGATSVPLGTATATDVVDASPVIANDAPLYFPLGTTVVTWTATDASGNTASATQSVTVVDTTPPALTIPADVTFEGNTIGGAVGVPVGSATAVDLVDASPVVTSDAPSFFPLGPTTVTWTATDASGNTASATQTITIIDTTPPTIVAPPTFAVIVGAPSSVLPTPIVTDIVDPNPTYTNNAPAYFKPGTTVVTWTATDASGNIATATTTITATYRFVGFFSPLNKATYKQGSTIPVKFQLLDYYGNYVTSAKATIAVDTVPGIASGSSNTANMFRYDSTANQYIYNLSTKPNPVGPHTIYVTLDDGSTYSVGIYLK